MKVLVCASDGTPSPRSEWKRVGTAIQYKKIALDEGKNTYAMEFMFELEYPLKKYYFSYGYPYSYTLL